MKKRLSLLLLYLVLVLSATCAQAAETRASTAVPKLSFSSGSAVCEVSYVSVGKSISITLQLYEGDSLVGSWTKSGTSVVTISEQCNVTSGRSYTLKAYGTCGGENFSCIPVTKICPM